VLRRFLTELSALPEGVWFKQQAEEKGFKEAVRQRDGGDPIAEGVSKPFYRF
jgi:enoyl-CoA hydratase